MLIKSRNFSPTKTENTFEQSGFGWAPGQEKRFKGMVINRVKYSKNYSMMVGSCKKCEKFTGNTDTVGGHCSLPENIHCSN